MKKIVLKLMLVALTVGLVSCEDGDNTIDNLFANTETGAFVRTLEEISDEVNLNDPSSAYAIRVEVQDEKFGDLFQSLDIYVIFDGDVTTTEALLATYTPSDATNSDNDLPELMLSSTFAELASAAGVPQSDVMNNDDFDLRLVLNLTDGRSYTDTDVNGNVSGGQYFQAPMAYGLKAKDL
jgi:hypothetical protein